MKKSLLVPLASLASLVLLAPLVLFSLSSCRVRHDHSRKMQQVRVPVDSTQKNDVEGMDRGWDEEDLIDIPDMPEDAKAEAHPEAEEEIERMMRGEDLVTD